MAIYEQIKQFIKRLASNLWELLKTFIEFPLGLFFQYVPMTTVGFFIKDNFRWLWDFVMGIPMIQNAVSKGVFKRFGGITPPRPHQSSMAQDYTNWEGLVNRKITGRHLSEDKHFDNRSRPNEEDLINAFMRPEDKTSGGTMTKDMRSTLLFASFAQWFTDSFLRTSHALQFDSKGNVKVDGHGIPLRKEGREKLNDSTHEIDLCQIYGLDADKTKMLRCPKEKGCLRHEVGKDGEYPERLLSKKPTARDKKLPIKKHFEGLHDENILRHIFKRTKTLERYETLFATGLEHSNSTIGNALLNTVFLREHNRIARLIAKDNPTWESDEVFDKTRNTMIVLLLKIVISDYIKHISPLDLPLQFQKGLAEAQTWYRTNRIHIEFNILYRWHGLVPSLFSFMPNPNDSTDFLHNNDWLTENGIAHTITAFSKEPAGKMVIGNTPRFLRRVKQDTVRLMRAAKLQPYNEYRKRFGLKEAVIFSDITDDPNLVDTLDRMYDGKIEDVEWYVGMCAEKHERGMLMGELMFNMVAHDAFTHALTNPLLSNEVFVKETFSQTGWDIIHTTWKLEHIVNRVVTPGQDVTCHFALNGEHTDKN